MGVVVGPLGGRPNKEGDSPKSFHFISHLNIKGKFTVCLSKVESPPPLSPPKEAKLSESLYKVRKGGGGVLVAPWFHESAFPSPPFPTKIYIKLEKVRRFGRGSKEGYIFQGENERCSLLSSLFFFDCFLLFYFFFFFRE